MFAHEEKSANPSSAVFGGLGVCILFIGYIPTTSLPLMSAVLFALLWTFMDNHSSNNFPLFSQPGVLVPCHDSSQQSPPSPWGGYHTTLLGRTRGVPFCLGSPGTVVYEMTGICNGLAARYAGLNPK